MLTVFIDESGKPSLSDRNVKYFVLSGVIVSSGEVLNEARRRLAEIKIKYNLDPSVEIHAKDLFRARPRARQGRPHI